jgi:hypothetical protein
MSNSEWVGPISYLKRLSLVSLRRLDMHRHLTEISNTATLVNDLAFLHRDLIRTRYTRRTLLLEIKQVLATSIGDPYLPAIPTPQPAKAA